MSAAGDEMRRAGRVPEDGDPCHSVRFVIARVRAEVEGGLLLLDAARKVKAAFPGCCLEVMETIGCYPSSERELNALQQVWP